MIKAENITYRAGKKQILNHCELEINPGKFTAVLGSNGAGKSTLLKAITGEITLKSGSVTINGVNKAQLKAKEMARIRAVMPQQTHINFPFTIEQIIETGRFPHPANAVENEQVIEEVIKRVNLQEYRGRIYQTLSGGERQRVQLARIMAQIWGKTAHSKYLLLDEPTSDMDILHQHSILGITRSLLNQNMGVMAILHDLNLAAQYADDLIFMKHGKILVKGPAQKVLTKENIEMVFNHPVELLKEPKTGKMVVVPLPKLLHTRIKG